jgi:endo-1,4-beta-xylanase
MNITKTKIGIAGVVDEGPAGNCSWFCQQMSSAPPHRPRKRLWLWTGAIVFAAATAGLGQNILQNPGFEAGTEGWFIVGPGASIETVTERPHSGAAACRVFDRTALYCGVAQSVLGLMQPGVTYQCSAWVRLDNATGEPISMLIRQTDESNNGRPRHQPLARIIATSNEWTQLTGRFTLDVRGTLKDLIFYFEGPAGGVDFLVDDVSIA